MVVALEQLQSYPSRFRAVNVARSAIAVAMLMTAIALLVLVFGRTGERIALQMCVNIAAVVALAVYCGNTGIVSFGHGAFMAVGAYLSGILTMPAGLQRSALPDLPHWLAGHELGLWWALALTAIAGLLFALLTGAAIARLVGASAAIASLGLLIIVHNIALSARELTRGSQTFYGLPRVTDLTVVVLVAVAFIILARWYRESRWGLFARAVRDDREAAVALGIKPERARLVAWTLSGMMATVSGALYGHILGAFSPASFYLGLVFAHVVMMIVGGMASVSGAVVGVITVTGLLNVVRNLEGGATIAGVTLPEVFGLTTIALGLAILLVIWLRPQGLVGLFELGPGPKHPLVTWLKSQTGLAPPPERAAASELVAEDLVKNFAGVKAVDGVSFSAPTGTVTGLIGPNGAGKSTLVNLITQHYGPDEGRARMGSLTLTDLAPEQIARQGIARSFQNLRLFAGLTGYENVLVAALARGYRRKEAAAIALRELHAFDLGDILSLPASSLSYGARKRLEIARALAQAPKMLLLDEPAAGMNPAETEDLADRLEKIAETRGIGILLIDHDLRFVNRLSSRIIVMNRGQKIAEGSVAAIQSDPSVIAAYIGTGRTARAAKHSATSMDQPLPTNGALI